MQNMYLSELSIFTIQEQFQIGMELSEKYGMTFENSLTRWKNFIGKIYGIKAPKILFYDYDENKVEYGYTLFSNVSENKYK